MEKQKSIQIISLLILVIAFLIIGKIIHWGFYFCVLIIVWKIFKNNYKDFDSKNQNNFL